MTDVSVLIRMVGADRASCSPQQLTVAERELRYLGHEHRQRFFNVRRAHGATLDKFTRRMLSRAKVAGLIGAASFAIGLLFVLIVADNLRMTPRTSSVETRAKVMGPAIIRPCIAPKEFFSPMEPAIIVWKDILAQVMTSLGKFEQWKAMHLSGSSP